MSGDAYDYYATPRKIKRGRGSEIEALRSVWMEGWNRGRDGLLSVEAERDDYRSKAITRQRDFDAAAEVCNRLQGQLDEARENVRALVAIARALGAQYGRAWLTVEAEQAWQRIRDRKLLEVSDE